MTITFASTFRSDVPATTVHVRSSWADSWTEVPYLHVDSLGYSIGGGFGRASLRYEYGRIMRPSTVAFTAYSRLSIDRQYVRIAYIPNDAGAIVSYWYGLIIACTDNELGNSAGNQSYTAVTLDWLLTQKQVSSTLIGLGSTGSQEIYRVVPFNAAEGATSSPGEAIANMSGANGPHGVPLFAENLQLADIWSASDILQYLIQYFSPSYGNDGPPWSINGTVWEYISWYSPVIVTDGRTVFDLINALIDSRRGLAWHVDASSSGCEIFVESYSPTTITLSSGVTIPLNSPETLEIDDQRQVARIATVTDSQQRYSQVRVTGARRGACFSIGVHDDTMVNDWGSTDELEYKAGDTTAATKTLSADKALHDTVRSSDALRHVYTRFRIADDFHGMAGNGTDYPTDYVCPNVDKFSGDIIGGAEPFWLSGLRFSKNLPLAEFHDYRTSADEPTDNTPTGLQPKYLETFAVANIGGTRVLTHELQAWASNEIGPTGGVETSSSIEVIPNAPAIYVRPTGMPHVQADGNFDAVVDGSDTHPVFEWETLICTVFVEWDSMVEAVYPEEPDAAVNDIDATLTIRFGDRARMDYLNRGTVLGVEDGELVVAQSGGFVRDDHAILRDTAKLAWQWYSSDRKALRLGVQHISSQLEIGDLVGTLNGDTVNSLVTSIRHEFRKGTTKIETQFINLDVRRMVG